MYEKKIRKDIKKETSALQKMLLILSGILLCCIILETGLRMGGLAISSLQELHNRISVWKKNSYRIMCVGESTTAGEYPQFLEESLNQHNIGVRFSIIDKGLIATNTSLILQELKNNIARYHPDMVVAMIGINDERAEHMPVDFNPPRRDFLHTLKIYKLMQLLQLHIKTKIGETKQFLKTRRQLTLSIYSGDIREQRFHFNKSAVLQNHIDMQVIDKNDQFYIDLGKSLNAQGKVTEAKVAFSEAIKLNPENTDAYLRLAWLNDRDEQDKLIKEIVELYMELLENCSFDNAHLEYLIVQLTAMHRYAEAEGLLRKLIHCLPSDITYVLAGETSTAQGRYAEAEELFNKAGEMDNNNFRVFFGVSVYISRNRAF